MESIEPWMLDDDAAWWAKLRRANQHRETLAELVAGFRAGDPYTLTPERTERADEVAYRLRILREAPADISTVTGDGLHNLRSALDSLAYELAVHSTGRDLTVPEQAVTGFPCVQNPRQYDRFFGVDVDGDSEADEARLMRGSIYTDRARKAMRVAQPFFWAEMGTDVSDADRRKRYREEFKWSQVRRLREMNNVDKHRRLNVMAFWPNLFYFGSNEGDNTRFRWSGVFADGRILCYLVGPNAWQTTLHHEFALVLGDDPMHRPDKPPYVPRDCLDLLEGFSQSVDSKVRQVLSEYARLDDRQVWSNAGRAVDQAITDAGMSPDEAAAWSQSDDVASQRCCAGSTDHPERAVD